VVLAIQNLALNDTNKSKLVAGGVLPLLVKCFTADSHVNIPLYVTGALWNLAFNADNKTKMIAEPGLVDLMKRLQSHASKEVCQNASGVLFQLFGHEHHHKTDNTHTKAEGGDRYDNDKKVQDKGKDKAVSMERKDESDEKKSSSPGNWDVMMSYNWASQDIIVLVARKLQQAGLRVWLDVDQMSGSTLDAMAAAVEGAKIVIVGVSKKYKDSASCRTEAQYAFQLGKQIVPLMMQSGYKADGWLGALLGTTLWFDCTTQPKMEESFPGFFREVKKFVDRPDMVVPSGSAPAAEQPTHGHGALISSSSSSLSASASSASASSSSSSLSAPPAAAKWTIDDVCSWLTSNAMSQFVKTVRKHELDGKAMVTLASMMINAMDLNVLNRELGIGRFVDQLKFTAAIKTLLDT